MNTNSSPKTVKDEQKRKTKTDLIIAAGLGIASMVSYIILFVY